MSMRPGMTALRTLGKICRFVSFRALSTDKTPRSSRLGQRPPVVLRKLLSINVLGWVFKHLIIGCLSQFFRLSGHMARTLRKDKDARARTQAKPYKAVESGGENEPLTMEFRTRTLLLSLALLFTAASGAQAQVAIDSVREVGSIGV